MWTLRSKKFKKYLRNFIETSTIFPSPNKAQQNNSQHQSQFNSIAVAKKHTEMCEKRRKKNWREVIYDGVGSFLS